MPIHDEGAAHEARDLDEHELRRATAGCRLSTSAVGSSGLQVLRVTSIVASTKRAPTLLRRQRRRGGLARS
jgi:hypothetical protein